VNRPINIFNPLLRDGAASVGGNYGSTPSYVTSKAAMRFHTLESCSTPKHKEWVTEIMSEPVQKLSELDFKFARTFWTHLDNSKYEGWQDRMVRSLGRDIAGAQRETREEVFQVLGKIHDELATKVKEQVEKVLNSI